MVGIQPSRREVAESRSSDFAEHSARDQVYKAAKCIYFAMWRPVNLSCPQHKCVYCKISILLLLW